ncbi:hypothetical protein [Noviherbaspirillum galbum]|uniref:Uncharacterized protein n=1 Tax=Noviherbaspirillum galbum TaxID=2709383 RepID=A0A6B3SWZ2_9BURK|nr:hypothetical protein [Noviherbaspirillum galbum]NEX63546.1 hypothetical protein [Noviherbaspirillum galbum]
MDGEIVLIKERNGYRIIYGHSQLKAILKKANEVFVDVKWEQGKAKIFRTGQGLLVAKDSRHLPLLNF